MTKKKDKLVGLDLINMFTEVAKSGFDLTGFNQIDESNIPKAPNFYVFITGREFCNSTLLPWQVEAGMHLFSEFCPTCTPHEYTHSLFAQTQQEIEENIVFLENGVCPKCEKNRLDLFAVPGVQKDNYIKNELVVCAGQRTGKSMGVIAFAAYMIHRWLKEADPVGMFQLPTNVLVDVTFTALTADQAERNLWIPFKQLYDKAPWFIRYNKFLKEEGKRLGKEFLQDKETFIFYKHKQLLIEYDGSNNTTQRGATRLFAVIDELAFFNMDDGDNKTKRKIQDAKASYAALSNSLNTVRIKATQALRRGNYEVIMPCMFNVSSPAHVNDFVMQLIRGAADNPYCHAVHAASWELNPDYNYEDLRASNAGLSEADFMRDFGAIPPFSDAPFISEPRTLEKLCTFKEIPIIRATREILKDAMGDSYLYLQAKVQKMDKITPRLLSLDNGYTNNGFSACVFRYDKIAQKPILEFAINLTPNKEARLNINFPAMYEHFILPIVQGLNIRHVFFDRWQSLDQIHKLRALKIDAQAYSLRYDKDFLPMRTMLESSGVMLPELEIGLDKVKSAANPIKYVMDYPIANLAWQALTVREVGKKLLKPNQGDDDIFRAFSLGVTRFLDQEFIKEYLKGGSTGAFGQSNRAIGSFAGLSRGGGAGGSASIKTDTGIFIGSYKSLGTGRK